VAASSSNPPPPLTRPSRKSTKAPSTAFHNEYFSGDAEKLLANSADYVARSTILNRNTAALAARLHAHAFGPDSPITKVLYPSLSDTAANYAAFLRPVTAEFF
jgi:cystathionine gamma-synthase